MSELMLINPRKRRRKRKMSALQKMYFGKGRRKRRRVAKRRYNPPVFANPKRRRRTRARYRRNPAVRIGKFSVQRFFRDSLMPASIGAAGALGLDMLMAFVPRTGPIAGIVTGPLRPVVRIAGAVGIGMLAGMLTNRKMGEQIGAGALTVVMYDTIKGFVQRTMPQLPLGEYQDNQVLEYLNPSPVIEDMGAYVENEGVGDFYDEQGVGEYVESEY